MKRSRRIASVLLAGLTILAVYESYAVIQARLKTPETFRRILSGRDLALRPGDISDDRIRQLLRIEDPNFYHHRGFDFSTPGAGLTTITQAVVKYLFFQRFKPGFMKVEQTLIAWLAVNALIGKDDQLTVFLNTAYFGTCETAEVRGFAGAARAYFDKPVNTLSDDEFLALVAMLIGPEEFSVKYHPDKNRERVKRIKKVLSGEYAPRGLNDVYYGRH